MSDWDLPPPNRIERFLRNYFAYLSLSLESLLCTLYAWFTLVIFGPPSSSSKAKAVVVYAANNDELARYFALRLASGTPSSFAFNDAGAGLYAPEPPYHVIVLLKDPMQLAVMVAEWARKKAEIEAIWNAWPRKERESPRSTSRSRLQDWLAPGVFGFQSDLLKGVCIGRTHTVEIGSIIPIVADVQTTEGLALAKSTISAYVVSHELLLSGMVIVPSILSPRASVKEDLDDDLFVLDPGPSRDTTLKERALVQASPPRFRPRQRSDSVYSHVSPPMSPTTERARDAQDDYRSATRTALKVDVSDTSALVHALFPELKRDSGRVVSLVPAGFGASFPEYVEYVQQELYGRDAPIPPPLVAKNARGMHPWPIGTLQVVREALKAAWEATQLQLNGYDVRVSSVVTGPLVQAPPPGSANMRKWKVYGELLRFRPRVYTLEWAWMMLTPSGRRRYNDPSYFAKETAEPEPMSPGPQLGFRPPRVREKLHRNRFHPAFVGIARSLVVTLQRGRRLLYPFDEVDTSTTRPFRVEKSRTKVLRSPAKGKNDALLFEAVRRALTDPRPRREYVVGLGPHVEAIVEKLPGAKWAKRSLTDLALGNCTDPATW